MSSTIATSQAMGRLPRLGTMGVCGSAPPGRSTRAGTRDSSSVAIGAAPLCYAGAITRPNFHFHRILAINSAEAGVVDLQRRAIKDDLSGFQRDHPVGITPGQAEEVEIAD